LISAVSLFFFFTNPFLINQVYHWWEYSPTPMEGITEQYELAIILGGFTSPLNHPRDRLHFHKGVDRFSNGLELFFQGKIKTILLTGASSRLVGEKISESYQMEKYLRKAGFPMDRILIEGESKNTWENATMSMELTKKNYPNPPKILLITSAFHMKRALGCYKKVGFQVVPFATDYYGYPPSPSLFSWILPDTKGFHKWNILIREWVGIIAYWIAGYM